jgi:ribosomal-protein-alanine N-acetyltransferase
MLTLDLSIVPELRTERLVLRGLKDSDAPAVFALRSDPLAMQYVPRPLAQSLDDAKAHIANILAEQQAATAIMWAITRKGTTEMLGIIGFLRMQKEHHRTEVGYMLLPTHWGQGISTEALAAVLREGFERYHFHSIEALVDPRNTGSIRVLERNGFVREAFFRENFLHNGEFLDTVVYGKLAGAN